MLNCFDLVWGDARCDAIQVSAGSADFSRFEHADTKPDLGEPTQLRMQVCAVATVREAMEYLTQMSHLPGNHVF